jgi:SAM-dependent methyltransferase
MSDLRRNDIFAVGAAYEPYVGRWSRRVAPQFLAWLPAAPRQRWLDVGCGTGALSQAILEIASPQSVKGIDRSEGFVQYAQEKVSDARATFEVGDAQALPVEDAAYDVTVSGLVLNFVPEPPRMIAEMKRATAAGGTVALYVWDYAEGMQLMRYFWDAAILLDPASSQFDEGKRFTLCQPQPLTELFQSAGLRGVDVTPIDVSTVFANFDDYWSPFLGGQGSAPGYVKTLSDEQRTALREGLRAALPTEPDGTIHLIARAWAVRGSV